MRSRLFTAAVLLLGSTAVAEEPPTSLPPIAGAATDGLPMLLSATPPVTTETAPAMTGGSTGLRPGIDCLPEPCDVCVNRPRWYGNVEYFLQWFEGQNVPPLVVVAPPNARFGVPGGVPGEFVLLGGQDTNFGGIDGIRSTVGYWLDSQQKHGVEISGFLTEQTADLFAAFHNGAANNPVMLARTDGTLAILAPVGIPGLMTGGTIESQHIRLWGSEINGVLNWSDNCRWRTDLLAGFRYLDLDESLDIQDFTQSRLFPSMQRTDSFDARTQFWGSQFGSRMSAAWGNLSLTVIGKLGLGVSHLSVDREGTMTFGPNPAIGGPAVGVPAGLLVNPLNAGHDTTNRFAALSETTIQVGYHWTRWLETTVGYNFMYLTSAVRTGDQVQPTGGINATDFYANGVTFGIACRY